MIKLCEKRGNGTLYCFGLSDRNIELLKEGKPIVIDMAEMGIPDMVIGIMYGETEEAIIEELRQAGFLLKDIDMSQPSPGETRVFRDHPSGGTSENTG